MSYIATYRGRDQRVQIQELGAGRFRVTLEDRTFDVDYLEPMPNLQSLLIDGRSFEVDVNTTGSPDHFEVVIDGDAYEIEVVEEKKKKLARKLARGAAGRQDLKSPMAGNVRQVLVKPGDPVKAGQPLLILEAMKMQNEIASPIDGVVASMTAKEGVPVLAHAPLCVVEPRPAG